MQIYNKRRQDFKTDDEYDTYLEQIEDKIYILLSHHTSDNDKKKVKNEIHDYKTKMEQQISNAKVDREV